jgi:Domain of unknown function (DUF4279)
MAERTDAYAYFWVEGFVSACEEVTAQMGIAPSKTRTVGDLWPSGRPVEKNWWELPSPLKRGDSLLQDHIEALLDVLESRTTSVVALASAASVGINCTGYYFGANPGLHLSARLIERLAALRLSVDFDLYNYAEKDAP